MIFSGIHAILKNCQWLLASMGGSWTSSLHSALNKWTGRILPGGVSSLVNIWRDVVRDWGSSHCHKISLTRMEGLQDMMLPGHEHHNNLMSKNPTVRIQSTYIDVSGHRCKTKCRSSPSPMDSWANLAQFNKTSVLKGNSGNSTAPNSTQIINKLHALI